MTNTNNFQFTQQVEWGLLEELSNSLATTMYATPYTGFNANTRTGMSHEIRYPILQRAEEGIQYDPANVRSLYQRVRNINLGLGNNVTFDIEWDQITFDDAADSQIEFSNRYLVNNVSALGEKVNKKTIVEMALYYSSTIGSATQTLNGVSTMADINSQFANMGLSTFRKRYFAISPNSTKGIQVPYTTYFNEGFNTSILKDDTTKFEKPYSGINVFVDESFIRIKNGSFAASGNVTVTVAPDPTNEDINQPFSTVDVTGFTATSADVLLPLNRIMFGSATNPADLVYEVNPRNYDDYGLQKTWVVLDVISADGSGNASINIYPPMVSSTDSSYQNVNRPIKVGDQVLLFGGANTRYTLNFAFVDQGLLFANPPISTNPPGSASSLMGGFSYQQVMTQKIPNSMLTLAFNLSSQGNHAEFSNTLSSRTMTGVAAFQGYGFGVASIF